VQCFDPRQCYESAHCLYYVHHDDLEAFQESSDNGCHFCAMMLDRLSTKNEARNFRSHLVQEELAMSQVVMYTDAALNVDVGIWIRCEGGKAVTRSYGETLEGMPLSSRHMSLTYTHNRRRFHRRNATCFDRMSQIGHQPIRQKRQ
jgi:hypothetical protein